MFYDASKIFRMQLIHILLRQSLLAGLILISFTINDWELCDPTVVSDRIGQFYKFATIWKCTNRRPVRLSHTCLLSIELVSGYGRVVLFVVLDITSFLFHGNWSIFSRPQSLVHMAWNNIHNKESTPTRNHWYWNHQSHLCHTLCIHVSICVMQIETCL